LFHFNATPPTACALGGVTFAMDVGDPAFEAVVVITQSDKLAC